MVLLIPYATQTVIINFDIISLKIKFCQNLILQKLSYNQLKGSRDIQGFAMLREVFSPSSEVYTLELKSVLNSP